MAANGIFEEFGRLRTEPSTDTQEDEQLEDAKLQSFEQGYGAGWEDAIDAQKKAERLLSDTVQKSLENSSITTTQAFLDFSNAMRPALEAALQNALPDLANRALPDHVRHQIDKLLETGKNLKLEVRVSSDQYHAVSCVFEDYRSVEAQIRQDKSLSSGQAYFAFNDSEMKIDLPGMIEEMKSAIETFYFSLNEET